MRADDAGSGEDMVVVELLSHQLEHFTGADSRCRGLQLPEGILLRYAPYRSLFFYLRTAVKHGKIVTRIFASDSPYDRQKTLIGEVVTPMFDPGADSQQLQKVERLVQSWVEFVKDGADEGGAEFRSFSVDGRGQSKD
jgi:hypothetical protein